MKKILAVLLASFMVFSLAACGQNSGSSEAAAPAAEAAAPAAEAAAPAAEAAAPAAEAAAPAANDDIYVGISINALDAINNQQTYDLLQQKCEAAGYKYAATNANGEAAQQANDIENLVQMGCNYIVVANGDTDGLTGAVQEAASKGVKVISVESGYIEGIAAYFAKNDFALGAAMYMKLAGEMGYAGNMIGTGHTGHPAIRARVNVQDAMLKEYTNIHEVTFVETGYPGTTELAYNGCETALQQYPDVETIWCTFDLEALGAAQACEDLGLADVKIVGADAELDVLKMIKEDRHIVLTSTADLEATTNDVIKTIGEISATGSTPMFHEMPYILITKENVDEWIERTEAYLEANK